MTVSTGSPVAGAAQRLEAHQWWRSAAVVVVEVEVEANFGGAVVLAADGIAEHDSLDAPPDAPLGDLAPQFAPTEAGLGKMKITQFKMPRYQKLVGGQLDGPDPQAATA